MPLRLAVVALALAACRVGVDFDGTGYQCHMDAACPAGQSCIDGVCQAADASPAAPCSKMADLFADDFEGAFDTSLWDSGTGLTQTGGHLELQTYADMAGNYSVVRSHVAYDLSGSRMFVEIPQMADTATDAEVHFMAVHVQQSKEDTIGFFQKHGLLHFFHMIDGDYTEDGVIGYSAADHRWWQLRDDGASTIFETSPDGTSFTERDRTATLPFLPWVSYHLGAGTGVAIPVSGGAAVFDHANGDTAPGGGHCPVASLRDDFDGPAPDWPWKAYDDAGSCGIVETGALEVGATSGPTSCGYHTLGAYDLRASSLVVEVDQVAAGVETFVSLEYLGGAFGIEVSPDGMIDFAGAATATYDADLHHWWRIAESGGMIVVSTAPDGLDWMVRASFPATMPLGALRLVLGLRSTGPASTAPARFARVNLPP